jgi:hypothetical protein
VPSATPAAAPNVVQVTLTAAGNVAAQGQKGAQASLQAALLNFVPGGTVTINYFQASADQSWATIALTVTGDAAYISADMVVGGLAGVFRQTPEIEGRGLAGHRAETGRVDLQLVEVAVDVHLRALETRTRFDPPGEPRLKAVFRFVPRSHRPLLLHVVELFGRHHGRGSAEYGPRPESLLCSEI